MDWTELIRGLNIRQRAVVWLGGVVLLLAILYPQFQTTYYIWVNRTAEWQPVFQTNKRMFVLDGNLSGMTIGIKVMGPSGYPELPKYLRDGSCDNCIVDKRDCIMIWDLILQILAIAAITVGLAWVLKSSPPLQAGQAESD